MRKYNIRFADFATRAALFELQVEQDTSVGALKAMAEEHLSNSDDLCPMKYFDKWFLEGQVGSRKRLMRIDEGDEGLTLAAAGLEDESFLYLEGPLFEEGQAGVGRAIAAVRSQAKAQAVQHALQVQGLMSEMGRRFDAMEANRKVLSDALEKAFRQQSKAAEGQFESLDTALKKQADAASEIGKSSAQQCAAIAKKFDSIAAKQQELSSTTTTGQQTMDGMAKAMMEMLSSNSDKLQKLSAEVKQIKDWTETQPMKKHKAEVDSLLQKHRNRPLKALWEVLNDKAKPGIELPMAVIMDSRCGTERRADLADGPMKGQGGFTINEKDSKGATPLVMAVQAGHNDVVSALLANGANPEANFGTSSYTALYIAAIINNVGAIELLASYGEDVSTRGKFNYTPLHQAAFNGRAAAIEALVRLGADLTIVNDWGKTPLQTFVDGPIRHHAHLSEIEK